MAFNCQRLPCLLLILIAVAFRGSEALCSDKELDQIFSCITPHNEQFAAALGLGVVCNRTAITASLCGSFGEIVTCMKGKQLSQTCLQPNVTAQINPNMGIACKVEDFVAVCTDVDAFWMASVSGRGDVTSAAPATQFRCMASTVTSLLGVMAVLKMTTF